MLICILVVSTINFIRVHDQVPMLPVSMTTTTVRVARQVSRRRCRTMLPVRRSPSRHPVGLGRASNARRRSSTVRHRPLEVDPTRSRRRRVSLPPSRSDTTVGRGPPNQTTPEILERPSRQPTAVPKKFTDPVSSDTVTQER